MKPRRGMSLIEIVFAMATLALAAMVVFTAIGFVHSRQKREQQMLACAEIANRLMLMRLDDESSLPDPSLSIAYDGGRYQWSMSDDRVRLLESPEVSAARALRTNP